MKRRFCQMCDDTTNANPCTACGADTVPWPCDGSPTDRFYQGDRTKTNLAALAAKVEKLSAKDRFLLAASLCEAGRLELAETIGEGAVHALTAQRLGLVK